LFRYISNVNNIPELSHLRGFDWGKSLYHSAVLICKSLLSFGHSWDVQLDSLFEANGVQEGTDRGMCGVWYGTVCGKHQ